MLHHAFIDCHAVCLLKYNILKMSLTVFMNQLNGYLF